MTSDQTVPHAAMARPALDSALASTVLTVPDLRDPEFSGGSKLVLARLLPSGG